MTAATYRLIKRSIEDGIAAGQWRAGDVLPSEHELCRSFCVSRMTVNRAMRELANENIIRRVQGVGSFVAVPIAQSALVEIRNIASEIVARGHSHRAEVRFLGHAALDGVPMFRSTILHLENEIPLQLEDRYVNPAMAPDYLAQDFTLTTPNEYLSEVAPIERGEHRVRAITAPPDMAETLGLSADKSVLLVIRRTFSRGSLVSQATLYHPGPRFELSGDLVPVNR